MAFSFYLNAQLSFLTEHSFIMLPLYLRGLGMGIIFTAILSVSLLDIPREKMAQASGISNVVRQLGGSFGVAILSTLLTIRFSYHQQTFSEAVNSRADSYKYVMSNIAPQVAQNTGTTTTNAGKLSQSVVVAQLNKEAFISAIDDDFLIATFAMLIGGIPVLFLRTRKKNENLKI